MSKNISHLDTHVTTEERVGEKTVTAMYTSKDDLTPLLYSGKIIKKKNKKKIKTFLKFIFSQDSRCVEDENTGDWKAEHLKYLQ